MSCFDRFVCAALILLASFTSLQAKEEHPIVYLVATPCSGMVEVLRMVHERGDFTVMHIPANLAYCHEHHYTDLVQGWYREDAPTSYEQAAKEILTQALIKPVFVGENTHTATEFLAANPEFAKRKNVRYVFLIGNPHAIAISHYKKKKDYFDKLPKEQMSNSIGLKELYAFVTALKKQGSDVFVCSSKNLYKEQEKTVRALSEYLHIPYMPSTLHWKPIGDSFSSWPFWNIENTSCSLYWHRETIDGTGLMPQESYAVDSKGNPTFEEVANEQHRKICIDAYNENKIYYALLMSLP